MITMNDLEGLEGELKELRAAYEKYFAGVDRVEPSRARDSFKRRFKLLTSDRISNTAVRFRAQSLQATIVTLEQYWTRTVRQIEAGTFRRDRMRRKLQEQARTDVAPTPALESNLAAVAEDPKYPKSIRDLHHAYAKARAEIGDHRPVSLEQIAKTVQSQYKLIKERYQCQTVEFKVAVKDGKAILKAVPK